jgi:hypothetical protein
VLTYLDELDAAYENDIITVVLPEFVLGRWWEQFLHNQSALLLKARLLFRRNTVVTSVPFHLAGARAEAPAGFNEPEGPVRGGHPPPPDDTARRGGRTMSAQRRTNQRRPRR